MFKEFASFFTDKAIELAGVNLSVHQIQQFWTFGKLLLEWNERINLTAITEPRDIVIKHFLDSLFFVPFLRAEEDRINGRNSGQELMIADLGTGAGFPGIPLKIALPYLHITLIDSLTKRLNFLQEVIKELNFNQITTYHARAEDAGRDNAYRGKYDIVTARALADLPVLLEYAVPLLKVGGVLLAAKGKAVEEEVDRSKQALKLLNCQVETIKQYKLGEDAEHHSLLLIRKTGATSLKYPRKAGMPKKMPLS
jgi:16S rRNA (guanine527-N7)-methyltransferase